MHQLSGDTSSIGIDELQLLLLKNALLLGVDFKLGISYEDADIVLDPKTQKPRWQVTKGGRRWWSSGVVVESGWCEVRLNIRYDQVT